MTCPHDPAPRPDVVPLPTPPPPAPAPDSAPRKFGVPIPPLDDSCWRFLFQDDSAEE